MSVDLGTGSNKLTLANVANTGSVSNVNTLIGGTGVDTITLGTSLANGSVDLGGGSDTLTLAAGGNTISVANIETIIGGTGADTVTLTRRHRQRLHRSRPRGSDTLTFGNFTNTATVANTETITGCGLRA